MNQPTITPYHVASSLYIPANHHDLITIASGEKYPNLQSIIICLEDALHESDIPQGLHHLSQLLTALTPHSSQTRPYLFIRPRHRQMAHQLVKDNRFNLAPVTGFVLPKFTLSQLADWLTITNNTHLLWMPVLETKEAFDVQQMSELRNALMQHAFPRILALRIGGNDLLNLMGLRRREGFTLYDGPMGYVIKMLTTLFIPYGFHLTAPVCEIISPITSLVDELKLDILHGLSGKTAIHPCQLDTIHQAFKIKENEYQEAQTIMQSQQAIFKRNDVMCEPATHINWANNTLQRAQIYGLMDNT